MTKLTTFAMTILIITYAGSWLIGYEMGKNSPCTQTEAIDIRPMD
jgi:hypothetical protein